MPCVPQTVRRTAAEVSAFIGSVLLASVIILALSLPWSAAYGWAGAPGPLVPASNEPDPDEPPGSTTGPTRRGPATPTQESPGDTEPPRPAPSTATQAPAPPEPSPTTAAPAHSTQTDPKPAKTKSVKKTDAATQPGSGSGTQPAQAPAEVTVAREWARSAVSAPDRVPAAGSVPQPEDASAVGGPGEESRAAARLAAADAAVPEPPRWPDQAFGMSLVAAGLISLAFSVGGIVVVGLRRRRW